jgi:hypothetical protein
VSVIKAPTRLALPHFSMYLLRFSSSSLLTSSVDLPSASHFYIHSGTLSTNLKNELVTDLRFLKGFRHACACGFPIAVGVVKNPGHLIAIFHEFGKLLSSCHTSWHVQVVEAIAQAVSVWTELLLCFVDG